MNIFEWIKNKKDLENELEKLDRELDLEKNKNAKLKFKNEELGIAEELKNKYLETIKEQRKEIKDIKKKNKFLMYRENKLQEIEFAIANKKTYKEVKEIVKGE